MKMLCDSCENYKFYEWVEKDGNNRYYELPRTKYDCIKKLEWVVDGKCNYYEDKNAEETKDTGFEVVSAICDCLNRYKGANYPLDTCHWVITESAEHYLMCLRDTIGQYIFRDGMAEGKLMCFPYVVKDCADIYCSQPSVATTIKVKGYVPDKCGAFNELDTIEPVYLVG
jgi:hypothetical protein